MSGVQRIAKFVKYLPDFGWAPTVLTVQPGGYFAFDNTLLDDLGHAEIEIVRTDTFDPTKFFKNNSTVSMPSESRRKWMSAISQFIFVPDNKIGWYRPAVTKATQLQAESSFDLILATAPPYTAALIAERVSRAIDVPYVLDFRDDWYDNPRHLYPTPMHRWIHRSLEKKAFTRAGAIITINNQIASALQKRLLSYLSPDIVPPVVQVVPQGYDASDFTSMSRPVRSQQFRLTYSGVFYDRQTPDYFLQAVALFVNKHPSFRSSVDIKFVGWLPETSRQLIDVLNLSDVVSFTGYVPHHEAIRHLEESTVLWMTVGKGPGQYQISTSKLFEYFGSRKPVLGLVPEGAARDALEAYYASWVVDPDQVEAIYRAIKQVYGAWKENALPIPDDIFVNSLERRRLTGVLSEILEECSNARSI